MPEAGPAPTLINLTRDADLKEKSDLANFGLMGDLEKEYSMPQEWSVCHDTTRVYGV